MSDIEWAEHAGCGAVADHLAGIITRPGFSRLAVPGGSTPLPILRCLGRRDLARARGEITLTDDRLVPDDHPASNYGLLRRTLGDSRLSLLPLEPGDRPGRFDLVWIGMGADGHIASIFPNKAATLLEGNAAVRTAPDPLPPEAPFERVTLPLQALLDTDELILVIRGREKRALLEAAIRRDHSLPIALLIERLSSPLTIYWSEQ
jgi:6-phosphogluconolactonase